jgi:hypothetical protein
MAIGNLRKEADSAGANQAQLKVLHMHDAMILNRRNTARFSLLTVYLTNPN